MDLNAWLDDLNKQRRKELEAMKKIQAFCKMQNDELVKLHKSYLELNEQHEKLFDYHYDLMDEHEVLFEKYEELKRKIQ